ncbi:MAG TPA: hypothetical protein VGF98_09665 [Candidatus Tumulicola sp.]|jgi:hypothetical protein
MTIGIVLEAALLTPVLQTAFGPSDPLGGYGATLLAQSVAQRDDRFAQLVDGALGAAP